MDPRVSACSESDTDEPPPLEDMSDVLKKMHFDSSLGETCSPQSHASTSREESERKEVSQRAPRRTVDKTSLVMIEKSDPMLIEPSTGEPKPANPPSKPLKRGFFDAKPKLMQASPTKVKLHGSHKEVPIIRPSKPLKEQQNHIPEFLRLDKDPARMRIHEDVKEMLKPTQELVKDVMENTDVKNGLEDPDIMAAVADIAENPSAIDKYKNNKKVVEFYNQLGKLMGDRIKKQDESSQKGRGTTKKRPT